MLLSPSRLTGSRSFRQPIVSCSVRQPDPYRVQGTGLPSYFRRDMTSFSSSSTAQELYTTCIVLIVTAKLLLSLTSR